MSHACSWINIKNLSHTRPSLTTSSVYILLMYISLPLLPLLLPLQYLGAVYNGTLLTSYCFLPPPDRRLVVLSRGNTMDRWFFM